MGLTFYSIQKEDKTVYVTIGGIVIVVTMLRLNERYWFTAGFRLERE